MDQASSKPTEDKPDWGRRRRGAAPTPRENWERVRDEFEQATRAWEQHRSDGGHRADGGQHRAEEERSWTPPGAPPRQTPGAGPDLSGLFVLLDTVRRAAPAELQERTTTLIREVLLTLRSLIDWYLERLESPAAKPEVEDIPID